MMSDKDRLSYFASLHYVGRNCNYLQDERNNSYKPSYARPSNYTMTPDDRKGNWGSRGFILGCHNNKRDRNSPSMENEKMPETKHHTMAWSQEQNR